MPRARIGEKLFTLLDGKDKFLSIQYPRAKLVMLTQPIITTLKSLKLFGKAGAVDTLAVQKTPAYQRRQGLYWRDRSRQKPLNVKCVRSITRMTAMRRRLACAAGALFRHGS